MLPPVGNNAIEAFRQIYASMGTGNSQSCLSSTFRIVTTTIMATTAAQHRWTFFAFVRILLALWLSSAPAAVLAPNPLPPSSLKCVDYSTWSTPNFMPKDCYTILARFDTHEVQKYGSTPFEFLQFKTPSSTPFRKVGTPRKYYFGEPRVLCGTKDAKIRRDFMLTEACACLHLRDMHVSDSYAKFL